MIIHSQARYVALDPGDRWVGMVTMGPVDPGNDEPGSRWFVTARVFDTKMERWEWICAKIDQRVHHMSPVIILTEEYRARAVGHQKWAISDAAKMIGALQYITHRFPHVGFTTVPTGDPDRELPMLSIGPLVKSYAKTWTKPGQAQWHHARAAFRVLGQYLLKHSPARAAQFMDVTRVTAPKHKMLPLIAARGFFTLEG